MAKKTYTDEDKKAYAESKRAEQREMLAQAIQKLCSSEGWHQYLQTRARFHNYSFSNTILIALQRPDATQVAGANKWNKDFERRVMEDQFKTHAIKILAPQIIYLKDKGKIVTDDEGNKLIDRIWYKTVDVYDVSQTEGEPVASIPLEPITGESHEEYLYRAEQLIKGLGADVDYGVEPYHWTQPPVVAHIDASKAVNSQVRELIHACAEIVTNDAAASWEDMPSGRQMQVISESAAYMVCQSVGLDTSGLTVPHIAQWGDVEEDPKGVLATLREFAAKIDEVAKTVGEAIS
jgi:hypothetical protein